VNGTLKLLFLATALIFTTNAVAQTADTTKAKTLFFSGAATITSKGLSTFPNLTLGKPAAILDFSMGGNKFRFEPVFRFALEGKPWTFIFWCRYELINSKKFQLKLGAHPAYSFKTITVTQNGNTKDILRAQQFFAGEVAPVFKVGKNINLGPYYIHAWGLEKDITQNSDFIAFRVNFSSINLTDKFFMKWVIQPYYLKLDSEDGYYINSTLSIARHNFPFSVSSTINQTFQSTIPGDDFLMNVNLTYTFGGKYKKI
jgi:hypothetical protein